jgi:hypothetical protein
MICLTILFGACQLPLPDENVPAVRSIDGAQAWVERTIRYKDDLSNWGRAEYWASPKETLDRGAGDCDDKSILFGFIVHTELGVPSRDIQFVIVDFPTGFHFLTRVDGVDYMTPPGAYREMIALSYDAVMLAVFMH